MIRRAAQLAEFAVLAGGVGTVVVAATAAVTVKRTVAAAEAAWRELTRP